MIRKMTAEQAMCVLYYLMLADGNAESLEVDAWKEIGIAFDPECFEKYSDRIIQECTSAVKYTNDAEARYEAIRNAIDKNLCSSIKKNVVLLPSRLLIWDMFAIAYSNGTYDPIEKRLIEHTARLLEVDRSIVHEMERMVRTSHVLEAQRESLLESPTSSEERQVLEGKLNRIRNIAGELIDEDGISVDLIEIRGRVIASSRGNFENQNCLSKVADSTCRNFSAVQEFVKKKGEMIEGNNLVGRPIPRIRDNI